MDSGVVVGAHRALDVLAAADAAGGFGGCDRGDLDVMLGELSRLRGVVAGFEVSIARRSKTLANEGRSETAEAVLGERGRRCGREAKAAAERERTCRDLPMFEDALASGAVSTGHVDALAAATRDLDADTTAAFVEYGDQLAARAETMTVAGFRDECRDLARMLDPDSAQGRLERQRRQRNLKRWVNQSTGMWHLHAELDPVAGAQIDQALDVATRAAKAAAPGDHPLSWQHASADALQQLITGSRAVDGRVPEVAVLVDWQTLLEGLHARSVCELPDGTSLPVSTLRRLCCRAEIFPVVLDGDGAVLDVGQSRRLATRAQRRALQAMYRTCGYPHCTATFDHCEIHHVTAWEHAGPTDLANLLPVCGFHHHQIHEGGWTLTLDPDRTVTLTRPDGAVIFKDTTTNRTPAASGMATTAATAGRDPPSP